ncbi:MAG: TspO/MBR family protein [Ferruginibacter sp.]
MKPVVKFIISVTIPLAVGAVAAFFTTSSVNGWFTTLNKPSFNPPNWLFAPVWTALYIMMGIAFFIAWKSNAVCEVKRRAIIFFFVQLTLNFLWSFIFFYAKQPGWALIDIILLWLSILITIIFFGKISAAASWLLVPYICWVSFATLLNFSIWKLN